MEERAKVLGIMAAIIASQEGAMTADTQRMTAFVGAAERLLTEAERVQESRGKKVVKTLNLDDPVAVSEAASAANRTF